jgi:hypothetical protein
VAAFFAFAVALSVSSAATSDLIRSLPWPAQPDSITKLLRVKEEFALPVGNVEILQLTGDQMLLFDINAEYFIGIEQDVIEPVNRLVAFPRVTGGEGTAWVTNEKQLIFGTKATSCAGAIVLRRNEVLKVVDETGASYTAIIERFGRQMQLEISKSLNRFAVLPAPPMKPAAAVAAMSEPASTNSPTDLPPALRPDPPAPPAPVIVTQPTHAEVPVPLKAPSLKAPAYSSSARSSASSNRVHVTAETLEKMDPASVVIAAPPPPAETPAAPVTGTVGAPTQTVTAAKTTVPESAQTAAADSPSTATSNAVAMVAEPADTGAGGESPPRPKAEARAELPNSAWLTFNSWTFWILLGTVLMEGGMIGFLFVRQRQQQLPPPAHAKTVLSFASVGDSITDQSVKDYLGTAEGGDLQGELNKFSMGHVVQFFHSSGESGTLSIANTQGSADLLIFDRGQIIDAVCGNRCGEAAAEVILRRRHGSFRFTREDTSKRLRLIQQDTMSMLMDAARIIDEKGWTDEPKLQ